MTTFDTLNLTARERQAHDAELLRLIRDHERPVSLVELFEGLEPRWAAEAAKRLRKSGKVREVEGERLEVIQAARGI